MRSICMWSNFRFNPFSHVGVIAPFQRYLLFLMLFLSKIFFSDTIWPIGTKLSKGFLHRILQCIANFAVCLLNVLGNQNGDFKNIKSSILIIYNNKDTFEFDSCTFLLSLLYLILLQFDDYLRGKNSSDSVHEYFDLLMGGSHFLVLIVLRHASSLATQ